MKKKNTHGGARAGAGRPSLEGGSVELTFVMLCDDRDRIRRAAKEASVSVSEWLRQAAERALTVEPEQVTLPQGHDCATVYATIPGALRPDLEARAAALGVKRLGRFLRLAALDMLKGGQP